MVAKGIFLSKANLPINMESASIRNRTRGDSKVYMRSVILLFGVIVTSKAYAYVGPGLGLGAIGALLGIVLAVVLAVVGVIWYPMKRVLKKGKQPRDTGKSKPTTANQEDTAKP